MILARVLFVGLVVLVGGPVGAQSSPPPDLAALGHPPWPGMSAWDVAWCKELVWAAGVVEVREPGKPRRLLWPKDVRGWKKPNGFYGLKINGQVIDEGVVWLSYAGAMTNLRTLFTYGSDPVQDVPAFRD